MSFPGPPVPICPSWLSPSWRHPQRQSLPVGSVHPWCCYFMGPCVRMAGKGHVRCSHRMAEPSLFLASALVSCGTPSPPWDSHHGCAPHCCSSWGQGGHVPSHVGRAGAGLVTWGPTTKGGKVSSLVLLSTMQGVK